MHLYFLLHKKMEIILLIILFMSYTADLLTLYGPL